MGIKQDFKQSFKCDKIKSLKTNARLNSEAIWVLAPLALLTFLSVIISFELGLFFVILSLYAVYYFREPARVINQEAKFAVAPIDGTVIDVAEEASSPKELAGLSDNEKFTKISIYSSLLDVKIAKLPTDGKVKEITSWKGRNLVSFAENAEEENSRTSYLIENSNNVKYAVSIIEGMFARKVSSLVNEKQEVLKGENLAINYFGNFIVNLYLPASTKTNIVKGQKLVAGETIIAEFEIPLLENKEAKATKPAKSKKKTTAKTATKATTAKKGAKKTSPKKADEKVGEKTADKATEKAEEKIEENKAS